MLGVSIMVKVSVIMPVFNASEYLEESINCILNQTLTDLELICIDDGSTDGSLNILNKLASSNSCIQVYHQENKGGGAARNLAITYATGEYLYCMDADDLINLDALEKLYNVAKEKDLDFVIFQAINYDDKLDKYYHTDYYDMSRIAKTMGDRVFSFDDLGKQIFNISVTPWCKLYNLDFVKKTGAQFAEGLIFHDNIFYWDLIFHAKRIYFLKEVLYTRRRHIESSTGAKDKRYVSTIAIYNMIIQRFIDNNYFEEYKAILCNKKMNFAYRRFSEVKDEYKPYFFSEMKKDFSKMLNHELYDEFLEIVSKRNKRRFQDVVRSKDYKEFKKLYDVHELKKNVEKKPKNDGLGMKFKKLLKKF